MSPAGKRPLQADAFAAFLIVPNLTSPVMSVGHRRTRISSYAVPYGKIRCESPSAIIGLWWLPLVILRGRLSTAVLYGSPSSSS